ncbi:MAG: hypothetical protein SGPRY_011622, partial [Prymnesium sp.]
APSYWVAPDDLVIDRRITSPVSACDPKSAVALLKCNAVMSHAQLVWWLAKNIPLVVLITDTQGAVLISLAHLRCQPYAPSLLAPRCRFVLLGVRNGDVLLFSKV